MKVALLVYLAIGVLFVGVHARLWWAEYDRTARQWKAGLVVRVIGTVLGAILDVLLWPHSAWREMRKGIARAINERFEEAVLRARHCPHARTVDVWPTPSLTKASGSSGPMAKCRRCWALRINGVWTPNIIPPPPEAPKR